MASRTHDDPIRVYLKSLPWVLNVSGNDCSRINKLAIMIDCVFLWLVHQQASIDDRLLFVCVCGCYYWAASAPRIIRPPTLANCCVLIRGHVNSDICDIRAQYMFGL